MNGLKKYALKLILSALITVVAMVIISFLILYLIPGDPATVAAGPNASLQTIERIRSDLGLDKPIYEQFFIYLNNILHGNLGESVVTRQQVLTYLLPKYFNTLELGVFALLIALAVGIPLGVLAAVKRGTMVDVFSSTVMVVGIVTPTFLFALLLLYIFSLQLGLFPTFGMAGLNTFILPGVALSVWTVASIGRLTRTSMIEILTKDYIRTAKASGLPKTTVLFKYALKNALTPIVTISGLNLGTMITSAVYVETIFAWPGIGAAFVNAIQSADYPVIRGGMLFMTVTFIALNTISELLSSYFDPRIRITGQG